MDKLDYKKVFKELYLPKNSPCVVEVPSMRFVMIEGEGDPNGDEFAEATTALYSFSYAVKMSYKSNDIPQGFYDYTVFPLEGVWDLIDKNKPATDKSNLAYTIMIRQPDFLTDDLFHRFINITKKKKPNDYLDKIKYGNITDGLCCQMLHVGSFDNEPASFEMMEQFCKNNGYERISYKHREIYLSDPRKTESTKLKTVLRFKVKNITKNGEGDIVVMSIEAFEKREQVLKLRSKIMAAENSRLSGAPTIPLEEARKRIEEKYNAKV